MNNLCRCPMCNGTLPNNIPLSNCNLNDSNTIENISVESNVINTNDSPSSSNCVNTNTARTNINTSITELPNTINRVDNNLAFQNISDNNLLNVLRKYLGRKCTCEFNTCRNIEAKTGVLENVGENFITLKSLNSNKVVFCSVSNLLFVTVNS